MQLVILVIHDKEHMNSILVKMMDAGIKGGSLLECEGALQALNHKGITPPPVFGTLREYLNPESDDKNKMLFCAVSDENADTLRKIVDEVTGGLKNPNTGVMLCLPLLSAEGI